MLFSEHFHGKKQEVLNETGNDFRLKSSSPRLLQQKFFPIIKSQKHKIVFTDEDQSEATLNISNLNDLVNIAKELGRDLKFSKDGTTITILSNG